MTTAPQRSTPENVCVGAGALRYRVSTGWGQLPPGWNLVEVAATATDWAAAVRSASGVCAWLHLSGSEVHTGSGTACTGQAAMAA